MFFICIFVQNDPKTEVLRCLQNGIPHRQMFPSSVRDFCTTLHFHSPRGYEYVRAAFGNTLPNPYTIRHWYANSDINGESGINEYCLNILKKKVQEKKAKNEQLYLALLFDEMAIRKLIQFSEKGMMGYEDFLGTDPAEAKPASNCIVYMASAVNDNFHLPVAFFFITSLNAEQKTVGLKKVARAIFDCGAILMSVSFDGIVSNPSMCRKLQANLDIFSKDFAPYFEIDGHRIHIFFDVSHVEKLVRNALFSQKIIHTEDGKQIKWEFIERLVRIKEQNNLVMTHKLNRTHINFQRRIMHVKTATETLSASVADSIQNLINIGHPGFVGAETTVECIRMFDNLFNAFNSKYKKFKDNSLKCPLSKKNATEMFEIFERAIKYIMGMKIRPEKNGSLVKLCSSKWKTGFQGYIVSMKSLMAIHDEYINEIDSIPTMSFSQDNLEIFFGRIRSMNGFNSNPSCQQFKAAFRKLLANTNVLYSTMGNCKLRNELSVCNPYSNISTISSRRAVEFPNSKTEEKEEATDFLLVELQKIDEFERRSKLTDLSEYSIAYCANIIEKKVLNSEKFTCELCQNVFNENRKIQRPFISSKFRNEPCQSTYDICKSVDHFMKLDLIKGNFKIDTIRYAVLKNLSHETIFNLSSFSSHMDHKLFMIKYIMNEYIRMKGVYLARQTTSDFKKTDNERKYFTSLMHFYHI